MQFRRNFIAKFHKRLYKDIFQCDKDGGRGLLGVFGVKLFVIFNLLWKVENL
jgi:hypothetical protein